jgi:flagellar biosynthesis chaperone FliJ
MNKTRVAAAMIFILLLAFGFGGACSYFSSKPPKKTEREEIQEVKKQIMELDNQIQQHRLDQVRDHNRVMSKLESLGQHAIKASQACTMAEILSRNSSVEVNKRAK